MSLALPSVSLRAFESVVRLRGFGRAAEELSVTQSAVSQHVKALEEWTGHRLLIRGTRETVATPQGQQLADAVQSGLGQIEQVCNALKSKAGDDQMLAISCPPGFAINWLFPRLLRFDQAHPDTQVSIVTRSGPPDFITDAIDAAIHYGPGGYSGLEAAKLMGERVFPVCSPALLSGPPPLGEVSDLANQTLLVDDLSHNSGTPPTWEFWAGSVGIDLPAARRSRRFGQSNLVIQAAKQGMGVALGREPLVIDALVSRELVRPFPDTAVSEYSYWLITRKSRTTRPALEAFSDWLLSEARNQPDLPQRNAQGAAHVRMDQNDTR